MKVSISVFSFGLFFIAVSVEAACVYVKGNTNTLKCEDGYWYRRDDGKFGQVAPQSPSNSVPSLGSASSAAQQSGASTSNHVSSPSSVSNPPGRVPARPIATSTTPSRGDVIPPYKSHGTETNENPGFSFDMYGKSGKKLSSCQATLFERNNSGTCFALSASHCFESVLAMNVVESEGICDPSTQPKHDKERVAVPFRMNTSHTGAVDAVAHVNKNYFTSNQGGDMAVIEWKCQQPPTMKKIPLCDEPMQDGMRVKYGKVMGRAGFFSGTVTQSISTVIDGQSATAHASAGTIQVRQDVPTEHGDSGGPLISEQGNCLLGALSGAATSGPGAGMALYGTTEQGNATPFARAAVNGGRTQSDNVGLIAGH
ncbi:MAG: trypsin-like serine protease [Deltaproteobacteria bacterium]